MQYQHAPPFSPGLPGARKRSETCDEVCKKAAPRPLSGSSPAAATFLYTNDVCTNNARPSQFSMRHRFCFPNHFRLRSHTFRIHRQRCKTRRRQHAFSVRVVPYWNKLPEEIVNAPSVETLKLRLDALWQSLFPEVPL